MAYLDDEEEAPVLARSPIAEAPPAGPLAESRVPPPAEEPSPPSTSPVAEAPVAPAIGGVPVPPIPADEPPVPPAESAPPPEAPVPEPPAPEPPPKFKGTRGVSPAIGPDEPLPDQKPRGYQVKPLQEIEESDPELFQALNEVGKDAKVSPYDLALLIKVRSGGDANYRGEKGGVGYFDITPEEHKLLDPKGELDPNNPVQNLYLGAAKWRALQSEFGRGSDNAFAAFFAGEDVVNRMLSRPENQQEIVSAEAPGLWEFLDRVKGYDAPDVLTRGGSGGSTPPMTAADAGGGGDDDAPAIGGETLREKHRRLRAAQQNPPPAPEPPLKTEEPPVEPALSAPRPQYAPGNQPTSGTEEILREHREDPRVGTNAPSFYERGRPLSSLPKVTDAPPVPQSSDLGPNAPAPALDEEGQPVIKPAVVPPPTAAPAAAASPPTGAPPAAPTGPSVDDLYRNAVRLGYKGTREQYAAEHAARVQKEESPDLVGAPPPDSDISEGRTRPTAAPPAAPPASGSTTPPAAPGAAGPGEAPKPAASTAPTPTPSGTTTPVTPPAAATPLNPPGTPAGVAPVGRALEGTTNNITIQGAVRAAQQGGPVGLFAYGADNAPRGMSPGNVWDNLENLMLRMALLKAGPSELMHMREWLFQYRHSGMYENLRKGYALMDSDPVAAMNYLAASHAFVQDGTILQLGMTKDGQIIGQRYDQDTHKPIGGQVQINRESVRKMLNLTSDPQKWAQTENAERQTNGTIAHQQVTEQQADARLQQERELKQYEAQRAADIARYHADEQNRRHQESIQVQLHNAAQSRQVAIDQANATREARADAAQKAAAERTSGIDKEIETRFAEGTGYKNEDGSAFNRGQMALASQYYKAVREQNPEGNANTAMEAALGMTTNIDKSGKKENFKTAMALKPVQGPDGTTHLAIIAPDGHRVAYVSPESLRGMGIPQVDQMLPATRPQRQVPRVAPIEVPPAPVLRPSGAAPAPPALPPLPPRPPPRERQPLRY